MLALLLAASIDIHGTWSALAQGDRVQLTMVRDHSDWGRTLPRSDFAISDADMSSPAEKPVSFTMKKDAGTIDFTGTFENGEGVGRFAFTPNPAFSDALRSMGVSSDEALDDEKLFRLAMMDVSSRFIREMQSLGLRENLDTYVRFRIHAVTPEFVRELNSLGYKTDGEGLVRFRIHGVTPEFVRELRDLGYSGLSSDDLVRFRIHGVTPEFVRDLRDLGYAGLSSDDLVRFRIHGVTPEYIRQLGDAGYHGIPAEKLIQMRIRGIDAGLLHRAANQ